MRSAGTLLLELDLVPAERRRLGQAQEAVPHHVEERQVDEGPFSRRLLLFLSCASCPGRPAGSLDVALTRRVIRWSVPSPVSGLAVLPGQSFQRRLDERASRRVGVSAEAVGRGDRRQS